MNSLRISDIEVSRWLNTEGCFELPSNRVVAIHAFQMLCPGCILHGIPQSKRLHSIFSEDHVSVIGLHTVFEHHEAMKEISLRAFLHEFRVSFPVGIDMPTKESFPRTMAKFHLQGTPSWLIFNRQGELRNHVFGQLDDIALGAEITKLALEGVEAEVNILKGHTGRIKAITST